MSDGESRFEQEIRFAVVMYGGVSLAIYINGVAQELLRMVRASAAANPDDLTSTEKVYRRIAGMMNPGRVAGSHPECSGPPRTRFVVDIISGTSAGGINGVALAKCLALQKTDMNSLEQTWLDKAQIDELFAQSSQPDALLDSNHMYSTVLSTLKEIDRGPRASLKDSEYADQIDLFVTATDLNGLYEPLQLAGSTIDERVHKAVFRFSYTSGQLARDSDIEINNDFTDDHNAMLAFAARCTSSFPFAFAPMCFDNIGNDIGSDEAARAASKKKFERFFPSYQAQKEGFFSTSTLPLGARHFADGGYLDNRPFSHAIDLIQFRSSSIPVQRKLLFVDPFPEYRADNAPKTEINFVENSLLALSALPRYQTIRNDIERINENNRQQDRLKSLRDEMFGSLESKDFPVDTAFRRAGYLSDDDLRSQTISTLSAESGCYLAYHILRKQNVISDLAELLAEAGGFQVTGDEAYFLRLVLRSWRELNFLDSINSPLENGFLLDYDIEFERRRINDAISLIDRYLSNKLSGYEQEIVQSEPSALYEMRSLLTANLDQLTATRQRLKRYARARIPRLVRGLSPYFHDAVTRRDRADKYKIADDAYKSQKREIDTFLRRIADYAGARLSVVRGRVKDMMNTPQEAQFRDWYVAFPWRDSIALPFFSNTESREHTNIEVYRVSPAESELWPERVGRADKKLAGIAAGAFGGFLQKSWRRNDIMWGRLDGAERIIFALLPDKADRAIREALVAEAQDTILAEALDGSTTRTVVEWLVSRLVTGSGREAGPETVKIVEQFFPKTASAIGPRNLREFIKVYYDAPPSPPPTDIVRWSSKALGLVSRMLDNIDTPKNRTAEQLPQIAWKVARPKVSGALRLSSQLLFQILQFCVPERVAYILLPRWLLLIALAGILLLVGSALFNVAGVGAVGFMTIFLCLLLWLAQQVIRRFVFRRQTTVVTAIATSLGAAILVAALAGPWAFGIVQLADCFSSWHLPIDLICKAPKPIQHS